MWNQASAIVWAQWRSTRNHLPRANLGGLVFTARSDRHLVWRLRVPGGARGNPAFHDPTELEAFHKILPAALLLCFLYWQVIPVLLTSMGASLDLRKLLVYPIPKRALFAIEVILRVSTGVEMLLLLAGAAIGLLLNPDVPLWAPFSLALFVIFNLFCSAGIRDLLVRLLAHKRVREIVVFLVVMAAALPQLMLFRGSREPGAAVFRRRTFRHFALDRDGAPGARRILVAQLGVLLAWTLGRLRLRAHAV